MIKSQNVVARSNKYYLHDRHPNHPILIFGLGGKNVFDYVPKVTEGVTLTDGMTAASACGTGAYVYDALAEGFELRTFPLRTE